MSTLHEPVKFRVSLAKPFSLLIEVKGEFLRIRLATVDAAGKAVYLTRDQVVYPISMSRLIYEQETCRVADMLLSRKDDKVKISLALTIDHAEFVAVVVDALKLAEQNRWQKG
jgi:hypothetical protein